MSVIQYTLFSFIVVLFNSTTSCFVVSSRSEPLHSTKLYQIIDSEKNTDLTITNTKTDGLDPMMDTKTQKSLVRNFRQSAGLKRIYRCANTDDLGILFALSGDDNDYGLDSNVNEVRREYDISSPEHILLHNAGLILDLRSSSERNETKARSWMSKAPGGKFGIKKFERGVPMVDFSASDVAPLERSVYRIDVLSPRRLFDYLADNWLESPIMKAQYSFCFAFDTQKLHEIRMDILNGKGIQGTYEAILETSKEELFASLKAITEYLESHPEGDVVVHCVQGKDRTGLVIMLCQSILGIDDATIIQDYHKSEILLKRAKEEKGSGSAAVNVVVKDEGKQVKGKLNRKFFSGAPEEAMITTLAMINERYGSINGYLDTIGFDSTWRQRFLASQNRGTDYLKSNL